MIDAKGNITGELTLKVNLTGEINKATEYIEPVLQEKEVTPTKEKQIVTYDENYNGLSQVTVNAIPDSYKEVTGNAYDTSDATITENDVAKDKIAYGANGKVVGQFEMPKMSLTYTGDGSQNKNFFELFADEDIQPYAFYTTNSTGWFRLSKVVTGDNCKIINTKAFQNQKKCMEYDFTRGVTTLGGTSMNSAFGTETILKLGTQCTEINNQAIYDCPKYLYCYAVEPPTLGTFNFYTKTNLVAIYVPDNSVETYKTAENWKAVADYIKPLSEA